MAKNSENLIKKKKEKEIKIEKETFHVRAVGEKRKKEYLPRGYFDKIGGTVASHFPLLGKTMKEAGMTENVAEFVKKQMNFSLFLTFVIVFGAGVLLYSYDGDLLLLIPIAIIAYPLMVVYSLQYPKAISSKKSREIDKDLLFAGRHLWISLKGGVPLFESMVAIAKGNYGGVSREMNKLIERVLVGESMDTAMEASMDDCPSKAFKRMLMQLVNSIRSGADVADSLEIVLDQLSREQTIGMKEYGQKLNPVVMFYLVMGIIVPSLGISVGILILSFANVQLSMTNLWGLVPLIVIAQYIFLSYAEISRPSYEI